MDNNKLVIMGSFVVDLAMKSPALPRRGETIFGGPLTMGPGGKGSNQCIAAKRAGADVCFLTKLGRDQFAEVALKAYADEGISCAHVYQDEAHETGSALIMVENGTGENAIVVSSGASTCITPGEVASLKPEMTEAGVFLTQFETNMDAVWQVLRMAKEMGLKTIVNPAPVQQVDHAIYQLIDIITPNETEAEVLTGVAIRNEADAAAAAEIFLSRGVQVALITLGEKGVFFHTSQDSKLIPGFTVETVVDTTGAGDAFNGGFATAIAEGMPLEEAVIFGNVVGALSVTKNGTAPAMPTREEIDRFLRQQNRLQNC
jgi:ribokinase